MLAIVAALQAACGRAEYPGLTVIGPDWVEHLCDAIARDCFQVDEINKSSDGRELRVVFRDEIVVVSPTREVRAYRKPGRVAWMNDDHEWVAWSDDLKHGFYIRSESKRTHVSGLPKFDSGGRFFAITEGNQTRLFRVKPYRDEATLPLDLASSVFSRPPFVYVVGTDRDMGRLHVYTYRDTGESLDFVASRVIERPKGGRSSPFYFSDIAAGGELFAIHDASAPPLASESAVLVYESTAGLLTPIRTGSLPWATLFLSEELRRRVTSRTAFTLTSSTSAAQD